MPFGYVGNGRDYIRALSFDASRVVVVGHAGRLLVDLDPMYHDYLRRVQARWKDVILSGDDPSCKLSRKVLLPRASTF